MAKVFQFPSSNGGGRPKGSREDDIRTHVARMLDRIEILDPRQVLPGLDARKFFNLRKLLGSVEGWRGSNDTQASLQAWAKGCEDDELVSVINCFTESVVVSRPGRYQAVLDEAWRRMSERPRRPSAAE